MALDHYVSQVYLRKFLSPELGNRMYAMRKSDLHTFTPRPRDICRVEDGNTNNFLTEERIVEEFLKEIEPRYNASVDRFIDDVPNIEHIYAIAGIISYLMICSPAAKRINAGPLRAHAELVARYLDEYGQFDTPPESLGNGNLTEMLADGRVKMEIDPQYPAAIGITNIIDRISLFGNSCWEIIKNANEGCEFFTSDYPVAIGPTPDPNTLSRFVPLTPKLGVRIIPDRAYSRAKTNMNFPGFRYRKIEINASEARRLNQLLVRCAEELVLASDWQEWRTRVVKNHRHYRLDTKNIGLGELMHSRTEIVPHRQPQ